MNDEEIIHVDTSVSSLTVTYPDGREYKIIEGPDGQPLTYPSMVSRPIPWKIP